MVRPVIGIPSWGDDLNLDLDGIEALAAAGSGMIVAATTSTSGPLQVGRHTPVDASGGAKSMSLPTGQAGGSMIGVEKIDASINDVTVTGNIRGLGGQSLVLPGQHTGSTFIADPAGSWWPTATSFGADVLDSIANVALAEDDAPAPASMAGGSAGSDDTYSRGDHSHPAVGQYAWFGTGSHGSLVLDGTVTHASFSKSGSVYSAVHPINATDLVLGAGVTLRPAGMPINVLGTLSGTGNIVAETGGTTPGRFGFFGPGSIGPAGGAGAGTGGVENGAYNSFAGSGAGGAGSGGAGGGANGTNTQFGSNALTQYWLQSAPSAFTGMLPIFDWLNPNNNNFYPLEGGASGGAGGGGGGNGGKGGNGGQVVIVNARRITGSVNIRADAENGGNAVGTNAGGGGGGAGGVAVLNTTDTTGWTGVLSAAGGAGGAKNGTGVAGSAGQAGITRTNIWV
jgi:hypothetical protein